MRSVAFTTMSDFFFPITYQNQMYKNVAEIKKYKICNLAQQKSGTIWSNNE